jgi:uncharacterized membrane protein YgaE (UPF0421/DUF939 family)
MNQYHSFIPIIIKNTAVTALAFTSGFYFTTLFHEPTSLVGGLWAVISAIIVLESTHVKTYGSAKSRIIGSLIGAIISGVYLFFFDFTIIGFLITIAIGVLVCLLFKIPNSIKLAGITISVVIIVSTVSEDLHPFTNAGLRFVESAIGTGTAILIAVLTYYIEENKPKNV